MTMAEDVVHPPRGDSGPARTLVDMRWWKQKERHEAVFRAVDAMKGSHDARVANLKVWEALYLDDQDTLARTTSSDEPPKRPRRTRRNLTANAVDTVHAHMTINRPLPWVVTMGGDWELQRRGEKMTRYLEGEFDRLGVWDLASDALHDALITDSGWVKVYDDGERPALEIVWPGEVIVDPKESRARALRTLYQRKNVDAEVLSEEFPDGKADIEESREHQDPIRHQDDAQTQMREVIEAWHLPVRNKDGEMVGGKHSICVERAALVDEDWEFDDFPFAKIVAGRRPRSEFGRGIVEIGMGSQAESDYLTAKFSECARLATPVIALEHGSKVNQLDINDVPFHVVWYTNTPPQVLSPPMLSPEFFKYRGDVTSEFYNDLGISELRATSRESGHQLSGKAKLIDRDTESQRWARLGRAWETFHIDIARQILRVTRQIAEDPERVEKLRVTVGKHLLEEITWKDVDSLGPEQYQLRVFPVSALSRSPQGRLQEVQMMWEMQVITDPEDMRELLNYPDLDRFNSIQSAGRELVQKHVDMCLDGERTEPFAEMPLPYAKKYGTLRLHLAAIQQAPESKMQRLRDWLGMIDTLIQRATPQTPAPGAPALVPPPGEGAPQPWVEPAAGPTV